MTPVPDRLSMSFADPEFASNFAGLRQAIAGINPDEADYPAIQVAGRVELRVLELDPFRYFDDRQMRPDVAPMFRGRMALMCLANKGDAIYGVGRPINRAGGMIGLRVGATTLNATAEAINRPDLASF